MQFQGLLKGGKGEIRRLWKIVLPPGIRGSSLTFTAAFPKYLTPRLFGLKHDSASIRHVHLSLARHIFRARFADFSFLFKKMMYVLRASAAPSLHDMLLLSFDGCIDDCHECVGHVS